MFVWENFYLLSAHFGLSVPKHEIFLSDLNNFSTKSHSRSNICYFTSAVFEYFFTFFQLFFNRKVLAYLSSAHAPYFALNSKN